MSRWGGRFRKAGTLSARGAGVRLRNRFPELGKFICGDVGRPWRPKAKPQGPGICAFRPPSESPNMEMKLREGAVIEPEQSVHRAFRFFDATSTCIEGRAFAVSYDRCGQMALRVLMRIDLVSPPLIQRWPWRMNSIG